MGKRRENARRREQGVDEAIGRHGKGQAWTDSQQLASDCRAWFGDLEEVVNPAIRSKEEG